MKSKSTAFQLLPVLLGFFVMGFCDIVGISSDYVQKTFNWSDTITGFVPSMVFIWFLFLGIPIGNKMTRWGRKNTVLLSLGITVIGMFLPLVSYNGAICLVAFALLGIGNTILQVSLNPLLKNVLTNPKYLASGLTAGQVVKALSSLAGPEIVLLALHSFGEEQWYYCFPILGIITLLSAIWLLSVPIEREQGMEERTSVKETWAILKSKSILLLFLGIFFIVGYDVATNFISSKLMAERFNWGPEQTKLAPQIYFLLRTVGAFAGTFFLTKVSEVKYFKINILLALLSVLALIFIKVDYLDMALIGALGFFGASVFSIIYAMALKDSLEKADQISGLMITAIAGGAAIPPVIGLFMDLWGVTGGVFVILLCTIYLCYCAFYSKR